MQMVEPSQYHCIDCFSNSDNMQTTRTHYNDEKWHWYWFGTKKVANDME